MFTVSYIPTIGQTVLLCNTSRSITEMNIHINHRRILTVADLMDALYARAFDKGNWRNIFSMDVRRDVDLNLAPFADPEAALIYWLDHPSSLPGGPTMPDGGVVKFEIAGAVTHKTRWMTNALFSAIDLPEPLGIAPLCRYEINGGEIVADDPTRTS